MSRLNEDGAAASAGMSKPPHLDRNQSYLASPQLHHTHRQVFLQLCTANLAVMYSTLLAVFSLSIREPARTVRNFPPPRSSLLVMWRQVIKN